MANNKIDGIALRVAVIMFVLSIVCLIITAKPSAEFIISVLACVISLAVGVIAAVRIILKNKKDREQ